MHRHLDPGVCVSHIALRKPRFGIPSTSARRALGACQEFTHEENTKGRSGVFSLKIQYGITLIC